MYATNSNAKFLSIRRLRNGATNQPAGWPAGLLAVQPAGRPLAVSSSSSTISNSNATNCISSSNIITTSSDQTGRISINGSTVLNRGDHLTHVAHKWESRRCTTQIKPTPVDRVSFSQIDLVVSCMACGLLVSLTS